MNEESVVDPIEIYAELRGETLIITPLNSEITFKKQQQFLKSIKDAIGYEKHDVLLDMKNVQIIDSFSLGTLIAALKFVRAYGGEMTVSCLSPQIDELFGLLRFHKIFKVYDSVEAALAAFDSGEAGDGLGVIQYLNIHKHTI